MLQVYLVHFLISSLPVHVPMATRAHVPMSQSVNSEPTVQCMPQREDAVGQTQHDAIGQIRYAIGQIRYAVAPGGFDRAPAG